MQNQQIDLIDTELAGTFLKTMQRLVKAIVTNPNLGFQNTSERPKPKLRTASMTCRSLP